MQRFAFAMKLKPGFEAEARATATWTCCAASTPP